MHHLVMACALTSYNPDLEKGTVQFRDISIPYRRVPCFFRPVKSCDISIPSRGVPCFSCPVKSRPVKFRGISIPSRAIPWNLNPVKIFPSNPVMVQSRTVPSRDIKTLPIRLGESRDMSIPRDPVTRPKFGPEESPGMKGKRKQSYFVSYSRVCLPDSPSN